MEGESIEKATWEEMAIAIKETKSRIAARPVKVCVEMTSASG